MEENALCCQAIYIRTAIAGLPDQQVPSSSTAHEMWLRWRQSESTRCPPCHKNRRRKRQSRRQEDEEEAKLETEVEVEVEVDTEVVVGKVKL